MGESGHVTLGYDLPASAPVRGCMPLAMPRLHGHGSTFKQPSPRRQSAIARLRSGVPPLFEITPEITPPLRGRPLGRAPARIGLASYDAAPILPTDTVPMNGTG